MMIQRKNNHIWPRKKYSSTSTCGIAMAKFNELLPHPLYSPGSLSDPFMISDLRKWISGKRFCSNHEIFAQTKAYFEDPNKSYYLEEVKNTKKAFNEVYGAEKRSR